MKNFDKSAIESGNPDQIHSLFSEDEILSPSELIHVKGGDGDGGGDIIIIPKKGG